MKVKDVSGKAGGLVGEFKQFIARGNVMDLAVGVIIGGAFSTITGSLTKDIIMPIVSIFLGGVDFSAMQVALPTLSGVVADIPNTLNYGNFLNAIINFFIMAVAVFVLVKLMNSFHRKKEAGPAAPPAPGNEEILLGEIRDLLKENKGA